jgi:ribose/xylose/arabinose/galactoside ABC-type transport system permease subunit
MAADQRCAGLLSGPAGVVSAARAVSSRAGMGVMTSGFNLLRFDTCDQEIVEGMIIIATVIVELYHQGCRKKA